MSDCDILNPCLFSHFSLYYYYYFINVVTILQHCNAENLVPMIFFTQNKMDLEFVEGFFFPSICILGTFCGLR